MALNYNKTIIITITIVVVITIIIILGGIPYIYHHHHCNNKDVLQMGAARNKDPCTELLLYCFDFSHQSVAVGTGNCHKHHNHHHQHKKQQHDFNIINHTLVKKVKKLIKIFIMHLCKVYEEFQFYGKSCHSLPTSLPSSLSSFAQTSLPTLPDIIICSIIALTLATPRGI